MRFFGGFAFFFYLCTMIEFQTSNFVLSNRELFLVIIASVIYVVLFVVTFLNSLKDLVEAEGFPCLDLLNGIEDTHLSLTGDFKDKKHTNVHGAIKFSGCLTDYLVANYGFTDKRGQAGWESWEQVTDYYK